MGFSAVLLRMSGALAGRIAVVGAGIAGLSAAAALSARHRVTLFEAGSRLGGHSNTVDIEAGGRTQPVDTGFIVYNERTYPNLTALLRWLGIETTESDMSFSVSIPGGPEFAASSHLAGLFARRRNLAHPGFLGMIRDLLRFQRDMRRRLAVGDFGDETLGEVLSAGRYGRRLRDHFLVPMAAAVWSGTGRSVLEMPAETYLRFCLNHGMLTMTDRPVWRTVTGGSRTYVNALAARVADRRPGDAVAGVRRTADGVEVRCDSGGIERFDHVVLATHSDQALGLLADATPGERALLGAIRYQPNRALLHRDLRFMPARRRAWSSWNYVGDDPATAGDRPVAVTYWMNRLQPFVNGEDVFVTLNPTREPERVDAAFDYAHPVFDRAAIEAQKSLQEIQGEGNIWFCGAWCGHGFHEDGLVAGMTVARWLGAPAPWALPDTPQQRARDARRVAMVSASPLSRPLQAPVVQAAE